MWHCLPTRAGASSTQEIVEISGRKGMASMDYGADGYSKAMLASEHGVCYLLETGHG